MRHPHVLHVSFASALFSQSATLLKDSASRFGVRRIEIYTPGSPAMKQAFAENPAYNVDQLGAGYWFWKPYVILDAMRQVPDGTPVLYTDAAVEYIADPAPLFALLEGRDIVLFENLYPEWTQAAFTRRDCFVLLDADTPDHWNARQLDAAFQLYRAGPVARAFLAEWKQAMRDPRVLISDAKVSGLPDLPGYIDHRYDQSVLTILARRAGVETFRSPAIAPRESDVSVSCPRIFDHHRRRNKKRKTFARMRIRRFLRLNKPTRSN